jgi:hypothetical protein
MAIVQDRITPNCGHLFASNINPRLMNTSGVEYLHRIWVDFSNIDSDPQHNEWRIAGTDKVNADSIYLSFSEGIDTKEPLPVLYELNQPKILSDGTVLKYGLITGNHRMAALKDLGYEGYWFDVVKVGTNGIGNLRSKTAAAIRTQKTNPHLDASIDDVVIAIAKVVKQGECANDEDAIKEFVKECCPLESNYKLGVITAKVCSMTGPLTHFVNWSGQSKSALQATVSAKFKKASHGNYDSHAKKYGFTLLDGYSMKGTYHAMKKFAETGRQSYFVGHVKSPNNSGSLIEKRMNVIDDLEDVKKVLIANFEFYKKTGKFPFELVGFLPQDATAELDSINKGEVLKFTRKELESLKQLADIHKLNEALAVNSDKGLYEEEDEDEDCDA